LPVASGAAIAARPARADARDRYAVARRQPAHPVADFVDGTDRLVAENPARPYLRHVSSQDVQVSAADRGGVDPDDDVAVVGDLRIRDFFPGLLPGTVLNKRSHGYLRVH
jgi:hypothetical protein